MLGAGQWPRCQTRRHAPIGSEANCVRRMYANVQSGLRPLSLIPLPMSRAVTRNLLLAALSDAELKRWHPHLQAVPLTQGQVLHQPGSAMTHVYFPTTAIVSLHCTSPSAGSTEI